MVKWFSNSKGYGFITFGDDVNQEEGIFVHHSNIVAPDGAYRTLVRANANRKRRPNNACAAAAIAVADESLRLQKLTLVAFSSSD